MLIHLRFLKLYHYTQAKVEAYFFCKPRLFYLLNVVPFSYFYKEKTAKNH